MFTNFKLFEEETFNTLLSICRNEETFDSSRIRDDDYLSRYFWELLQDAEEVEKTEVSSDIWINVEKVVKIENLYFRFYDAESKDENFAPEDFGFKFNWFHVRLVEPVTKTITKTYYEPKRKILAEEASVEELIADITHWEDPDSNLIINHGYKNNKWYDTNSLIITISDMEGRYWAQAPTIQEALIEFKKEIFKKYLSWDLDLYEKNDIYLLDWSNVIGNLLDKDST